MVVSLNKKEVTILKKIEKIKEMSGSHSPSPAMLTSIGKTKITYDFCYLSNPYATDLFLQYFRKDFKNDTDLYKTIERYPSQARALSAKIASVVKIPSTKIFAGNGATEIIQAVLHNFTSKKILVPIPTFSPYIEFVPPGVKIIYHTLKKERCFKIDVDEFLADIKKQRPDTVVIINPNNPDGSYLNKTELMLLLAGLNLVETVILDESFIHYASKDQDVLSGSALLVDQFPNLIVVKSLSKDFGIAGLRLGYAIMTESRVSKLLRYGYLWNISGFGEYFLDLFTKENFQKKYNQTRLRAIKEKDHLFKILSNIKNLKVYESSANFFLVELIDGSSAEDLVIALLVRHNIYIRSCKDKVGLVGEFVRIACRNKKENNLLKEAIASIFNTYK